MKIRKVFNNSSSPEISPRIVFLMIAVPCKISTVNLALKRVFCRGWLCQGQHWRGIKGQRRATDKPFLRAKLLPPTNSRRKQLSAHRHFRGKEHWTGRRTFLRLRRTRFNPGKQQISSNIFKFKQGRNEMRMSESSLSTISSLRRVNENNSKTQW